MNNNNIKWQIIFTREGFSFFISCLALDGYVNHMKNKIGWGYSDQAYISNKHIISSFYSEKDAKSFRRFIKSKNNQFILRINNLIIEEVKKTKLIIKKVDKALQKNKISNQDLIKIINLFYNSYRSLYSIYRFPTLVDEHNDGNIKNSVLYKLADTKDKCGKLFTSTDQTTLRRLTNKIAYNLGVNKDLVLFMDNIEIINSLKTGKLIISRQVMIERKNFYVTVANNSKCKTYIKNLAKQKAKRISRVDRSQDVSSVKGKTAYAGVVEGKVSVVRSEKDFDKSRGRVLVCSMTTVKFTPHLKDYLAIVTDEGGITCHACIVSRELKIPCIVGTKNATKVFNDGDLVEVNATKGVVKKI